MGKDERPLVSRWLTVDEAALIAKRSPLALRMLRFKGRGPNFRKVDGRLRVSIEDLDLWLSGDSGASLELICGICGFRGTPIVAGAHDCAALSNEGGGDE
jgi:hypothetical protein